MNAKVAIVLIIISLICVPLVAAEQTSLLVTVTDNFLSVDGDQATISVNIKDQATQNPIPGIPVSFSVNNPALGTLDPLLTQTGADGTALSRFTTSGTTGKVTISVDASPYGNWSGDIYIQGYPDGLTLVGSKDWLVAGDTANTSVLTLTATNRSNPIPMLDVEFSVLDPTMGSLAPTGLITTNISGKCTKQFVPSTKSGNATIQAVAIYEAGGNIYRIPVTYIQKIDHSAPYRVGYFEAPSEMLVGDTTPIRVHYVDAFNNSIDNRRYTENVTFSVTSPTVHPELPPYSVPAGFWNGTGYSTPVNVTLDANGDAIVTLRADTLPGYNRVTVHPLFGGVADTTLLILGVAESAPVSIDQYFSTYSAPNPYPNIPADGATVFNITYVLRDQFGNGIRDSSFWMNTSLGETKLLTTNATGMVKTTYGPKTRTDIINITVTAVNAKPDGTSAFNFTNVEVTSTEPVMMVLTANPQYLPSWDVPGNNTANIRAVVMDRYGNPVKNQSVVFTIVPNSWTYNYAAAGTTGPKWQDYATSSVTTTTTTHETPLDAYASLRFQPGYFPGYGDPPQKDWAIVTAQWGSYAPQVVGINWTNVPFLSISTNVTPLVGAWNDTITVNVKVEGNGYKLKRKPIDVMLLLDTSGSMAWDINHDYGTSNQRINAAKAAAKQFIGNMDPENDRVGLVSFASTATLRRGLTSQFSLVNSSIDGLSATGATNMRTAFKLGIDELATNGRPDALKAVILLSDGEWNYEGSPVAHGTGYTLNTTYYTFSGNSLEANNYRYFDGYGGVLTSFTYDCDWWGHNCEIGWRCLSTANPNGESTTQNMSRWATANNVRIYDIFFASSPSATVNTTLAAMANANSGFYEYAPSASKLNEIFERIAGILKTDAGVGVVMDLPFSDVTVSTNTTSWTVDGDDIFTYLPNTYINKYWFNVTPFVSLAGYPQIRDDTTNFTSGNLDFSIGTIKLNQAWETTFRLKLRETNYNVGRISIFDQNSLISFSDGKDQYTLSLPNTYITCIGNQSQTVVPNEEAGYDITSITNESTVVTVEFDRIFIVNGTSWNQPWYRTWYEDYFLEIPGYMLKTKIGSRTIPDPVPLHGTYTFDIKPYLPPGSSSVNYNFFVEGTDHVINAVDRITGHGSPDDKIHIFLQ